MMLLDAFKARISVHCRQQIDRCWWQVGAVCLCCSACRLLAGVCVQTWGMLEHLDSVLGRLFDYVFEGPLASNTYIMMMGDNGSEAELNKEWGRVDQQVNTHWLHSDRSFHSTAVCITGCGYCTPRPRVLVSVNHRCMHDISPANLCSALCRAGCRSACPVSCRVTKTSCLKAASATS